MTADYDAIRAHAHAIEQVVPLLEAIRSVAEIAFRRAEERLPPLARYAEQLDAQLAVLPAPAGLAGAPPRTALVVIASERGLCGSFNRHLVLTVRERLEALRAGGETVDLLCLGRQGERQLAALHEPLVYTARLSSFALPSYLDIEKIALDVLELMEARACSRLVVVHNAPLHRFQHEVVSRQLFPVDVERPPGRRRPTPVKPADDAPELVRHLVSERVLIDLYRSVIESAISEELARVAAMRLAADSARHLLEELSLAANQARQVAETNALIEIITGYRATTERSETGAGF